MRKNPIIEENVEGQLTLFEVTDNPEKSNISKKIWEQPDLYLNPPETEDISLKEIPQKKRGRKKATEVQKENEKTSGNSNSSKHEDKKPEEKKTEKQPTPQKPTAKKLKKKELKEYSRMVLEEYDIVRIGGIMRCCRVSANEAEQVREYMEAEELTFEHKKRKKRQN